MADCCVLMMAYSVFSRSNSVIFSHLHKSISSSFCSCFGNFIFCLYFECILSHKLTLCVRNADDDISNLLRVIRTSQNLPVSTPLFPFLSVYIRTRILFMRSSLSQHHFPHFLFLFSFCPRAQLENKMRVPNKNFLKKWICLMKAIRWLFWWK